MNNKKKDLLEKCLKARGFKTKQDDQNNVVASKKNWRATVNHGIVKKK